MQRTVKIFSLYLRLIHLQEKMDEDKGESQSFNDLLIELIAKGRQKAIDGYTETLPLGDPMPTVKRKPGHWGGAPDEVWPARREISVTIETDLNWLLSAPASPAQDINKWLNFALQETFTSPARQSKIFWFRKGVTLYNPLDDVQLQLTDRTLWKSFGWIGAGLIDFLIFLISGDLFLGLVMLAITWSIAIYFFTRAKNFSFSKADGERLLYIPGKDILPDGAFYATTLNQELERFRRGVY